MPVLRDFDIARRERAAKRDPVQFRLGGELFTLLPVIPMGGIFDLADAPEPGENETAACRALVGFIRLALIDEDQPRWDALLARRTDVIEPADIIATGYTLAEHYSGRPSLPSSDSPPSRRSSGATSRTAGRRKGKESSPRPT